MVAWIFIFRKISHDREAIRALLDAEAGIKTP